MNELPRTQAAVTASDPKPQNLQPETSSLQSYSLQQIPPPEIPRVMPSIPIVVKTEPSRKPIIKRITKETSFQNLPRKTIPPGLRDVRRIPIPGMKGSVTGGSAIVDRQSFSTKDWEKSAAISTCEVDLSSKGEVESPKKLGSPKKSIASEIEKGKKRLFKKTKSSVHLKGHHNENKDIKESERKEFDVTTLPYVKKQRKQEFNKIVKDYLQVAL